MKSGNPQLENGYTRIANELLEAIIKKCKEPIAVFFAVARDTYGYKGYKSNEISNKRMCELTGIKPAHISRAVNTAVKRGYIFVTKTGERIHPTYRINKKYLNWKSSPNLVNSPKLVKPSPKLVKSLTKTGDAPYKENIKKPKEKKRAVSWPKEFQMTEGMKEYAVKNGIDSNKVDAFFEDFHNDCLAHGRTYKDWQAAFRTRVSKAKDYGEQFLKNLRGGRGEK
jgi:phage replication O-like protein O